MIRSTFGRLFFVPVLLFSIRLCVAEAPSGQINLPFDPAIVPLWDFSGAFAPTNQTILGAGGTPVPFIVGVDLTQDARGRLSGSGITVIGIGEDFLAAGFRASGRVTGGGNNTKVNLVIRFGGPGTIAGVNTPFRINVTYHLQVNPADGTLVGFARGHANISKFGGGPIKSDVVVPIAQGTNAGWELQMNVVPLKKIGGTGAIVLSNGRTLQGNLTGSYSPRLNLSKIKFTGINENKGSSLNLTLSTSEGVTQVLKLRGRVLGQTLRQ